MNMGGMGEAKLDGTPFNVLMQQAVKLKTHVHKIDRVRFDACDLHSDALGCELGLHGSGYLRGLIHGRLSLKGRGAI